MTSVDTVRDFFRFLTEQRIKHLKMASGRYGEVEEPGANAVSYPGAITKRGNGSHGGHGGRGGAETQPILLSSSIPNAGTKKKGASRGATQRNAEVY